MATTTSLRHHTLSPVHTVLPANVSCEANLLASLWPEQRVPMIASTVFALHLQEASTGLYSVGTPWQDTWKQFRSDHNLFKDATTLNLLHDFWEPKLTTEQIHFLPKESITVACSNSHLIWTLTFFITNKTSLLTDQLSIKTVLSIQNTPNCLHNSQITLTPAIKL